MAAVAAIPGFRTPPVLATAQRTATSCNAGPGAEMRTTRPANVFPGRATTWTVTLAPTRTRARSASPIRPFTQTRCRVPIVNRSAPPPPGPCPRPRRRVRPRWPAPATDGREQRERPGHLVRRQALDERRPRPRPLQLRLRRRQPRARRLQAFRHAFVRVEQLPLALVFALGRGQVGLGLQLVRHDVRELGRCDDRQRRPLGDAAAELREHARDPARDRRRYPRHEVVVEPDLPPCQDRLARRVQVPRPGLATAQSEIATRATATIPGAAPPRVPHPGLAGRPGLPTCAPAIAEPPFAPAPRCRGRGGRGPIRRRDRARQSDAAITCNRDSKHNPCQRGPVRAGAASATAIASQNRRRCARVPAVQSAHPRHGIRPRCVGRRCRR